MSLPDLVQALVWVASVVLAVLGGRRSTRLRPVLVPARRLRDALAEAAAEDGAESELGPALVAAIDSLHADLEEVKGMLVRAAADREAMREWLARRDQQHAERLGTMQKQIDSLAVRDLQPQH